jgi:exodeoxyribonuclease VII large subunit
LSAAEVRARECVRADLSGFHKRLAPLEAHLIQLSPLKILERGYAIVEQGGKIVKSPEDAPVGSNLNVRLGKGEIAATVTKK